MEFLNNFLEHYAYIAIFLGLLVCGLGVPIPEEVFLIAAGITVYKEQADLLLMSTVAMSSIMLGDSLAFYAGKYFAHKIYRFPLMRKLLGGDEAKQSRIQKHFEEHSFKTIFVARFLAGLRAPTFFFAGGHGVSYWRFFFADFLAALISVPTQIWIIWTFGKNIEEAKEELREFQFWIFVGLGIAVAGFLIWFFWRKRKKRLAEPSKPAPSNEKTPV